MLGDPGSGLATPTTATTSTTSVGGGPSSQAPPPPPDVSDQGGHDHKEDRGRGGGDTTNVEGGGEASFGGNSWPRQETLALLKIRSDMDVACKKAGVKGILWEEVSRKLAELGYNKSAKKCREKFENMYKYHKRTKEGRSGKSEGSKTCRFFNQLETFENHPCLSTPLHATTENQFSVQMPVANNFSGDPVGASSHVTVPSPLTTTTLAASQETKLAFLSYPPKNVAAPPQGTNSTSLPPCKISDKPTSSFPTSSRDPMSNSASASTSSDLELLDDWTSKSSYDVHLIPKL